jgi:hypothetical protein
MWYVQEQTQPVFAPKLPAPRQVFNQLRYRTGVLVQSIRDCSSFQVWNGHGYLLSLVGLPGVMRLPGVMGLPRGRAAVYYGISCA